MAVTKKERKSFTLRVSLWNHERDIQVDFPSEWDVTECRMAGHDFTPLSDAQIQEAFENPIGTPRIRDLAKGKQKVVILFDDMSRPTPFQKIFPFIIKELEEVGISTDKIRLVCAIGCHRPLSRHEMITKLGRETVEKYMIFNHNAYEHHVRMGTTSRGTPVLINREVASCDLKIGIGSLIPHNAAGYGGGAKILLPGVSAIESIVHNHVEMRKTHPGPENFGQVKGNVRRMDIEEAARIAGLDVIVNVVANHNKESLGIFVGDLVEAHRKGVAFANTVYRTENCGKFDIMVLNTFPIEETPRKALWAAKESLKDGGDVVLVWQNEEGVVPHYLLGVFGSDYGGRDWHKPGPLKVAKARSLYIYSENLSKEERKWWGPEDQVFWMRDWKQLIASLKIRHGQGTKVAVYPYCTLQCPVIID